ncbi:MAG: hypothetical protein ITG02_01215 [Patulibacter sp.]|nr:hypothetical protein [Patulibacter sp.]
MTTAEYDEMDPAEVPGRLAALNKVLAAEADERLEHTKLLAEVLMLAARRG